MLDIKEYGDAAYSTPDNSTFDVKIKTSQFGWITTTLHTKPEKDEPPHFKKIRQQVKSGKIKIDDYVDPRTNEEIVAEAQNVRAALIDKVRWRIERFESQKRLGIETTDSIETIIAIDNYLQKLRDMKTLPGYPDSIQWPVLDV